LIAKKKTSEEKQIIIEFELNIFICIIKYECKMRSDTSYYNII
jgi:hypothetical protein